MRKKIIWMAALMLATTSAAADDYHMQYTVSMDTAKHYLNVNLTYTGEDEQLKLKMPVWAPGYYSILDFPKHLCDFSATDRKGERLSWHKESKNTWVIDTKGKKTINVSYRIFANERDVASSRVDANVAFIAPNGVFMYKDTDTSHPLTLTYDLPSNWKNISSGLKADTDNPHSFTVPSFDILFDSPFLIGNHYTKSFTHEGHDYEFAIETPQGLEESRFESSFRAIVSTCTDIIGDVPYDNYCLIHLGEGQGGLEHLNSQACYTDGTYEFYDERSRWLKFLSFVAHEYFHLYNVKTIRPIELGPFDYDREAYCPLIWFCEGITCYYETLILERAGLCTEEEKLLLLSNYMKMDELYDGKYHQSLRMTSYDIWLNFMNEDANSKDVRINYYFRGPSVGLIMDIEIQRLSNNRHSLDDLMRLLYNRYYKEAGRGFTEEEFWNAVDEVAGASMSHVRDMVDKPGEIDYERYLTPAGIKLDREKWIMTLPKNEETFRGL